MNTIEMIAKTDSRDSAQLDKDAFIILRLFPDGTSGWWVNPSKRPLTKEAVTSVLGNCTLMLGAIAEWCREYLRASQVESARLIDAMMKMGPGDVGN